MTEKKKVIWIYCGKRISYVDEKRELFFAYHEIVEGEELAFNVKGDLPNIKIFAKAMGSSGKLGDIVGGKYEGEVEYGDNGSMTAHGVGVWTYKGTVADEVLRAALRAKSDADTAEFESWRKKKTDASEDPLLAYLEPVRQAYHRTNTVGKRALIAKVLEYIAR